MFEDREFSWKYFFMTGNINAYLLTKELQQDQYTESEEEVYTSLEDEME
ncbi:YqzL family protein [Alteribacillus sp. JSM 102045]